MKSDKGKIAILMAAYNGELYIKDQIESIVRQSYENWILYINDDGSTDHTVDIVKEYQEKYPDKIVLSYNQSKKHGATANFADLLGKVSAYEFYAFSDQDDIWRSDKLEKMVSVLCDSQGIPMLVYCRVRVVDKFGTEICDSLESYVGTALDKDHYLEGVLLSNYVPGCAMMFNRELMEKIISMPMEVKLHDWWTLVVAACVGKISIASDESLMDYRQHDSNTIGATGKKGVWEKIRSFTQKGRFQEKIEEARSNRRQAIIQAEKVLCIFRNEISVENIKVIEEILHTLKETSRVKSLYKGYQYHYIDNAFYKKVLFWWFGINKN